MIDIVHKNMRIWHIGAVPSDVFYSQVWTLREAIAALELLENYEFHLMRNGHRRDASNSDGLQVNNGGQWHEWHDEDGRDIFEHFDSVEMEHEQRQTN